MNLLNSFFYQIPEKNFTKSKNVTLRHIMRTAEIIIQDITAFFLFSIDQHKKALILYIAVVTAATSNTQH